jgi:hypothetical protein
LNSPFRVTVAIVAPSKPSSVIAPRVQFHLEYLGTGAALDGLEAGTAETSSLDDRSLERDPSNVDPGKPYLP